MSLSGPGSLPSCRVPLPLPCLPFQSSSYMYLQAALARCKVPVTFLELICVLVEWIEFLSLHLAEQESDGIQLTLVWSMIFSTLRRCESNTLNSEFWSFLRPAAYRVQSSPVILGAAAAAPRDPPSQGWTTNTLKTIVFRVRSMYSTLQETFNTYCQIGFVFGNYAQL